MAISYSDIQSAMSDVKRYKELKKQGVAAEPVLEAISYRAANDLLKLFRTYPSKKKGDYEYFNKLLVDVVRPNQNFYVIIEFEGKVLECSDLIKSIIIPEIKRERITFQRAGLTYNRAGRVIIPTPEIPMTFYQDITNKSLGALMKMFTKEYDYVIPDLNVTFMYTSIISSDNSSGKLSGALAKIGFDALMDVTGIGDILDDISGLFPSYYSNTGRGETHKKIYDNPNQTHQVLSYSFENCYFDNIAEQNFDMERTNMYSQLDTNLVFGTPVFYVGEHEVSFENKSEFEL